MLNHHINPFISSLGLVLKPKLSLLPPVLSYLTLLLYLRLPLLHKYCYLNPEVPDVKHETKEGRMNFCIIREVREIFVSLNLDITFGPKNNTCSQMWNAKQDTQQHRTWVLTYLCRISGAQFTCLTLNNVSADDKKRSHGADVAFWNTSTVSDTRNQYQVLMWLVSGTKPAPSQFLSIVQNTSLHAIFYVFYTFILNYIKKPTSSHQLYVVKHYMLRCDFGSYE